MKASEQILLAKSKNNGGNSLLGHTRHVVLALRHIAPRLGFTDIQTLMTAAALHDAGKAHPKFQSQLREADGEVVWKSLYEKQIWNFVHRHELSSLFFLAGFPREQWDTLIEAIVAHHKSIAGDRRNRGLLDLIGTYGIDDVFKTHFRSWDEWSPLVLDMLKELGYNVALVNKESAYLIWKYAIGFCEKLMEMQRWSALRGVLMAADHFASAMGERTDAEIEGTFKIPDLSVFEPRERGGLHFPLADVRASDYRPHTILVAPTGAGKTNFLLRRCRGRRVFYTLPFQASINAMWLRFKEALPEEGVRMQHASSRLVLKREESDRFEEEYPLHGLVGASIKVLTPHQLATIVLGLPGFEAVMLDLKGTAVVLDEIHTYADVSRTMVLEIVKVLLTLDCSIHIGTATMPTAMYRELLSMLGGIDNTYEVSLNKEQLSTYNRHEVYKISKWEDTTAVVQAAMEANEKVLIVCNTVKKSQEVFRQLQQKFGEYSNMLIHSRFRRKDRAGKEADLRNKFEGKDGKGLRPCWVVATQVVEVSLDISFDRMITACAPIDALIQRFGRINRRRTPASIGTIKPVHVVAPSGDQRPYKRATVENTFDVLPYNGTVLEESSLQLLLDKVYPDVPESVDISSHSIWKNSSFLLPPLCNRNSSVLNDTLEINSASCILECDREAYENGNWEERPALEIPVSYNAIGFAAKQNHYPQLEIGTRPFVIPQAASEHEKIGLILHDYDTFL